jgi:hypothetical protein
MLYSLIHEQNLINNKESKAPVVLASKVSTLLEIAERHKKIFSQKEIKQHSWDHLESLCVIDRKTDYRLGPELVLYNLGNKAKVWSQHHTYMPAPEIGEWPPNNVITDRKTENLVNKFQRMESVKEEDVD